MPRSMHHSLFVGDLEGTPYVGIKRTLTDDAGTESRAKGGIWVKLEGDTDAVLASLTDAAEAALEFAAECERIHAKIASAKPKAAPKATKAPKAPTPPKAQAPASKPTRKDNTRERLAAEAPKVIDSGAVEANRKIAIANARIAAAPRVSNPAPKAAKSDTFSAADWANLIG